MLNSTVLIGRITRDPELYGNGTRVAKMTMAVDDGWGDKKRTDYIPITTFGKLAEFCEKQLEKGTLIAIRGKIRTGSYEKKDGTKVSTMEVVADELKKLEWKKPDRFAHDIVNGPSAPEGFTEINEQIPF